MGAGEAGFAISLPTLFEKSGAEGLYRRFKFELIKFTERNDLPSYETCARVVDIAGFICI
ncbi:replication initiator protein A [Kozakia baliensis]|uniref:replication initiator protein A n=1 Tax=Kozakia baliensis TaxID=153496 RepID=UPI0009F2D091